MMLRPHDDRRDSPRVLSRLFVRGLGADRALTDRLGDLALGGVGFELPHAPEADEYMVRFACPGEEKLREARATVVSATPLPGTLDREGPFFVHLQFRDLSAEDEWALARSLDRLTIEAERAAEGSPTLLAMAEDAHYSFDIEEVIHSLLPVSRASSLPIAEDADEPLELPVMSSLPERARSGEGGLGHYMWGYLGHSYRDVRSKAS